MADVSWTDLPSGDPQADSVARRCTPSVRLSRSLDQLEMPK